jgi:T4-like virus tail tube protein gp19
MKVRTLLSAFAALGLLALAAAGVGAWTSNAVGAGGDPPPAVVAAFALVLNGNPIAFFGDLELRSGVVDPSTLELAQTEGVKPFKRTPATVTLKRGLSSDMELSAWHELALTGAASARKDVSLVMYDATLTPVARYQLENAWPAKLELQKSNVTQLLMESVTLVADRIQRVSP